jgi:ketosteroid isomerase-like protein
MSSADTTFIGLAAQLLSNIRDGSWPKLDELLDEHVVMELPYAPQGVPKRLEGRAQVMASLAYIGTRFKYFRVQPHALYECRDLHTVIVEATSVGQPLTPAPIYQNRYVFVFTFRDGRVVYWKEFFDPYPVIWSQAASRS